jgi:hypothetical protein
MIRLFVIDRRATFMLLAIFFAYILALGVGGSLSVGQVVACAAINVFSIAVPSFVVRHFVLRHVGQWSSGRTAAMHVAASIAFTMSWYWILLVLLGAFFGQSVVRFSVSPFFGRAAVWQIMQGLTFYALLAAIYQLTEEQRRRGDERTPVPQEALQAPPFFYRDGDDIRPLDSDRIIFLKGADDYVEVTTTTSTHFLRTTMGRLNERLGATFLRVHRSCLVNSRRIVRAEPAGDGRMLLEMENGALITTSRAGARTLRAHMV